MANAHPHPYAVVYQLELATNGHADPELRDPVNAFLKAHGIDPNRVILPARIFVGHRDDDTLWVHTRQAPEDLPLCEHCDHCIATDVVITPLVAPVPCPGRAYINPQFGDRLLNPSAFGGPSGQGDVHPAEAPVF